MFIVAGARQTGKTERLIRELCETTNKDDVVRFVIRHGSSSAVSERILSGKEIPATCHVEFNPKASIDLFPIDTNIDPDIIAIDHVCKKDPESLLKFIEMMSGIEKGLGFNILLSVNVGFDQRYYQSVTGHCLEDDDRYQFVWL